MRILIENILLNYNFIKNYVQFRHLLKLIVVKSKNCVTFIIHTFFFDSVFILKIYKVLAVKC